MKKNFEPFNTMCLVCNHILKDNKDIVFVNHYLEDGQWHFQCDKEEHTEMDGTMVTLAQILKIAPDIVKVLNLPVGYCATRKGVQNEWEYHKEEE